MSVVTASLPRPWPNPNTGQEVKQYPFNSQFTPFFSWLHSQWYVWSGINNTFIKILPLDVELWITSLSLALWIQDDGFWDSGVILCTDNFTLAEVQRLQAILESKFSLKTTINLKTRKNSKKVISHRIRIAASSIPYLRTLVQPYFVPSMLYKLGIGEKGV